MGKSGEDRAREVIRGRTTESIVKLLEGEGFEGPAGPLKNMIEFQVLCERAKQQALPVGDSYLGNMAKLVKRFHDEITGQPMPTKPTQLSVERMAYRENHLEEELKEFKDAYYYGAGDLAKQADALIDLIYVAIGGLLEMGFAPGACFEEVHRANMDKHPGKVAKRGNVPFDTVKPSNWFPPDIAQMLEARVSDVVVAVSQRQIRELNDDRLKTFVASRQTGKTQHTLEDLGIDALHVTQEPPPFSIHPPAGSETVIEHEKVGPVEVTKMTINTPNAEEFRQKYLRDPITRDGKTAEQVLREMAQIIQPVPKDMEVELVSQGEVNKTVVARVGDDGNIHPVGNIGMHPIIAADPGTGFKKDDKGKDCTPELIPAPAEYELGRLYAFGAIKYDAENWRKGANIQRYVAGLRRHELLWRMGQRFDQDPRWAGRKPMHHMIQVAWNAITIYMLETYGGMKDDRPDATAFEKEYSN